MQNPIAETEHQEPGRVEAVSFFLKSRVLIARRWFREIGQGPSVHPRSNTMRDVPVAAEAKALLWTQISAAEFPLTAGKVQNLRAACRRFNGLEIPQGEVFSFWKQLGRTTRGAGFTVGRELRSGCLVPNLGGGLCQLSGLLHAAALDAGLEVVERHEHSRTLPGTPLPSARDATVFWNYVDLRFKAPFPWRLEAELTSTHLRVCIRAAKDSGTVKPEPSPGLTGRPVRAAADGDCLTCGVTTCFRHPSANRDNEPASGHTAWLLEGLWPEFNAWCGLHSHPGDEWMTPLDGHRWKRTNYAWTPPENVSVRHPTWDTLGRSWRQRRLPSQGAVRQKFLLNGQRQLAEKYARHLDSKARHIVVSQTLLPYLWQGGHLGGRTFDVLVNRWPMAELQARLDIAAARHPESDTLVDFRADPVLIRAESEAFAAAARIVTPHRAIAAWFGSRAILLEWELPRVGRIAAPTADGARWFFPASALARKGIHEIAEAISTTGGELLVLGRATEGRRDPLQNIAYRKACLSDLVGSTALVIPAWIEHDPRLALRSLAMGIPVIASKACGLPKHQLLTEIETGDVESLKAAMLDCIAVNKSYVA